MIVSKVSDGLGNQMFQYAIARYLSLKNKTDVWLDISSFINDKLRNYNLDFFYIHCKTVVGFELPYINRLADILRIKKFQFHYYTDKIWEFDDKLYTDNHQFIHLSGYWGWPFYFKGIKDVLRTDFRLKIPLETTCAKWVELAERNNSVSLHVRRSDYISDNYTSQFFGALDIEYYRNAIEYINQHVSAPCFLLFSDDLRWVKEKFIPVSGLKNYFLVEDGCFTNPAQELTLMNCCRHNIIANSTFSWWGACLNQNQDKIVIQPYTWYADKNAQEKYQEGSFDIDGCIKL